MPYQGVTYNIPIIIWLIESYPRYPPVVYVNPTRDMIIKRPHPHVSPSGAQPSQTEDAAEVYRRNAVNKLVEMVHGDIIKMRKEREAEMEGLFSAQGVLRKREEEVNKGLKEMQDEKEALEQQLQVVLMSTDVLAGWVGENEGKIKNLGNNNDNVDVDEVFHCADVLSKQMLDCTAADLAIEDVVYSLDKALQEGAVPFDQYLRNVRLLSREQFFHKATAAKVRAAQMQAQVASMAARAPHSHYAP
ncbi:hypothetical protein Gotri_004648 [Gossypium trilobum]|uniref:SB domain-containing protein n=1 Tax=Gossypium trilobum TaxID=34281 RepID=A0A7J9F5I2_9ROSI|nr:hypothetical protein [Gossypium trilobum]